jgi:iron complex outermembrane receptor protein
VVFGATTGTVGLQHRLSDHVQGSLVLGAQDLITDDRLAYPFGCTAENNFDRYCSDGSFDVYDFRSNNEHRRTESAKLVFDISGVTGPLTHVAQVGTIATRSRDRFEKQAYNYVGVGNINGTTVLPENSATNDENTNRDSNVVDVFLYDSAKWSAWGFWAGLRSSSIDRSSVRTDGSRPTDYTKNFMLPWAAISYDFEKAMSYFSYGEGVETFVTPNRATYTQPGRFVDDVRSRQYELGLRHPDGKSWKVAAFEIHRPVVTDQAPDYKIDGEATHRGVEAELQTDFTRVTLGASAMVLEAKRQGSTLQANLNGLRPVNVPKSLWRVFADYQWSADLKLSGRFSYEDDRAVTADNSILLSAWSRWDAGVIYQTPQQPWSARFFVENILDTKFWKESPTQYGHIYLYPGQERTFTLDLAYRF